MSTQAPQMVRGRMLCTFVARKDREDPVPSAVRWDRCLAIEVDTPWSKEITGSSSFPPGILDSVRNYEERGSTLRVQGLMRDEEYSVPGHTRILQASLARHAGRYETAEYVVPSHLVGNVVDRLLNDTAPDEDLKQYCHDISGVRDILVCTHGSRDACCARFGYQVYRKLRDEYASASDGNLRVWRTSHTGGHRFAPTLIDLPEGRYWAWVGNDSLNALLTREGSVEPMIGNYRGSAALGTAFEQVAEREALRREGWPWTEFSVHGRVVQLDEAASTAEVRLDFRSPGADRSGSYAATVRRLPDIVTEGCASAELGKTVAADQYQLEQFALLD